jgi:hypothetical protein
VFSKGSSQKNPRHLGPAGEEAKHDAEM